MQKFLLRQDAKHENVNMIILRNKTKKATANEALAASQPRQRPRLITENNFELIPYQDLSAFPNEAAITTRVPLREERLRSQATGGNMTTRVHTLAPVISSGYRNLLANNLGVPETRKR